MAKAKKKETLSLEEKLEQALVPVDEQPYEVPENWCWVYALNLFDIEYGKGLPTKNLTEEGYPVFGANGQIGFYSEYMYEDEKALMSCRGAYSGTMNQSLPKSYVTSNSLVIEDKGKFMLPKYICYMYEALDTSKLVSGSAQPQVTVQAFDKYPVPLPPLAEQQRIVEQIESLFAKLDEAKEKTLEALEGFDNRRAAILNKAFRGELTNEWRRENGVDLSSWSNKPFKEFCLLKRGFDLPTQERIMGEYPLVTSSGVNDYISDYRVKGPGVITGRSGTIGKVFLVEDDYWPLNTTLYSEKIYNNDPEYIFYFLQTFDFKQYSSSTAVPTLNRNLFADVVINVPSKEEQMQIVKKIKVLLDSEEYIRDLLATVINNIELMKKTVLAKAFRGELGTNNPEEETSTELLKSILSQG